MGDRAYVELVCREEDEPLFEAFGFMQEFRHALPANVVTMVDAESSEGATTELQALAEKGIVFRGWHDAGGSYDGLLRQHRRTVLPSPEAQSQRSSLYRSSRGRNGRRRPITGCLGIPESIRLGW